jgi:hypothetical protein
MKKTLVFLLAFLLASMAWPPERSSHGSSDQPVCKESR